MTTESASNRAHRVNAAYWRRRARMAAMRFNIGWWLSLFLPAMLALNLIFCCAALFARRSSQSLDLLILTYVLLSVIFALISFLLIRTRFYSLLDGLAYLESALKLHNRLSSAEAGVGEWPDPRSGERGDGLHWNWKTVLGPLGVSALLIAAAFTLPVSIQKVQAAQPVNEPLVWEEIEHWADLLEAEELVDQEALESIREQVAALREQGTEDWFDHGGMEAGDSLFEQTQDSVEQLERNLSAVNKELAALQRDLDRELANKEFPNGERDKPRPQTPEEQKQAEADAAQRAKRRKNFERLLEQLEQGAMPLDPKLLDKLKELDPSEIELIDPQDLDELKKQMSESGDKLALMLGGDGQEGEPDALIPIPGNGSESDGAGPPGSGGVSRGPGTAPLELSNELTPELSDRLEGVSPNTDQQRVPGELVGLSKGEHEVDTHAPLETRKGGGLRSSGGGGSTVWKGTYSPQEREVIKKYFD